MTTQPTESPEYPGGLPALLEKLRLLAAAIGVLLALVVSAISAGGGGGGDDPPPVTNPSIPPSSTPVTIDPGTDVAKVRDHENPAGLRYDEALTYLDYDALDQRFGGDAFEALVGFNSYVPPAHSQGQFRKSCTVSHFAPDDPIIRPGQFGASHYHMFFGNTLTDADTTADSLLDSGNSSCQGDPLNRSAYWIPAMLDADENPVMPELITLYYKTYKPGVVQEIPQSAQMLSGNFDEDGNLQSGFRPTEWLHWGCDNGSKAVNLSGTIPGANGTGGCPDNQRIQATIQFGQCFAVDPNGDPVLGSEDHLEHVVLLGRDVRGNQLTDCPDSHPYEAPQITYLIKWDNPPGDGETGWHLSSDLVGPFGTYPEPGGTLHGDWWGAWHDETLTAWHDGCMAASRNCSLGMTGTSNQQLDRLNGERIRADLFTGDPFLGTP